MPAWEFFNTRPIKQIRDAIKIVGDYLHDDISNYISATEWQKETGKQLHHAVNSLLIYIQSIDNLPEAARHLARKELEAVDETDLISLQGDMQTEALINLNNSSMGLGR